tara:strand:+ start:317 stop:595 length:279 start_codon:yes stop_codon:yes gene_type:complete
MNKSKIIEAVHKTNIHLREDDVQDSVNLIISFLSETLSARDRTEIRGFGTFSVRKRNSRIARNPKTGASIKVNEKFHPYFRASTNLKDILKK